MKKLRDFGNPGCFAFMCPGCKSEHIISTQDASAGHQWGFNGNLEKPTFSPSYLLRMGHYVTGEKYGKGCGCKYNEEHPEQNFKICGLCHSFIVDGKIQFLSDCTHELAGQTVELPNY